MARYHLLHLGVHRFREFRFLFQHSEIKGGEQRLIDLPEALVAKFQGHIRWLKEKMLAEGKPVDLPFPGITERIVQGGFRWACLAAKL